MARISLSRLCKQEEDHELDEVRCKHGFVLPLFTSWTPRNPGRRYWSCPYYGNARSCDFWLWKDDYIDPRSKFVIPKLLKKIGELEQSVESFEKIESFEKVDDNPTRTNNSVESKVAMNKIEMQLVNFEDDLKKMKVNEKKWRSRLAKSKKREKQLWITLLCVCILGISFVFQNHCLNGYPRRLP